MWDHPIGVGSSQPGSVTGATNVFGHGVAQNSIAYGEWILIIWGYFQDILCLGGDLKKEGRIAEIIPVD